MPARVVGQFGFLVRQVSNQRWRAIKNPPRGGGMHRCPWLSLASGKVQQIENDCPHERADGVERDLAPASGRAPGFLVRRRFEVYERLVFSHSVAI